jgi:hypothetical protein
MAQMEFRDLVVCIWRLGLLSPSFPPGRVFLSSSVGGEKTSPPLTEGEWGRERGRESDPPVSSIYMLVKLGCGGSQTQKCLLDELSRQRQHPKGEARKVVWNSRNVQHFWVAAPGTRFRSLERISFSPGNRN